MIGARFIRTTFGDCFRALHHERLTKRANVSCRFGFDSIFAFRIVHAAVEETESSSSFGHLTILAEWTFDAG